MKSLFTFIFVLFSSQLHAVATDWQLSFQNPATDLMQKVISLHDGILIAMTAITLFVLFLLFYVSWRFSAKEIPIHPQQPTTQLLKFYGQPYQ